MGTAVPGRRGRDRVRAARTRRLPRSDPVVPPVHGGIDPAVREDESLVARRGPSGRTRHLSYGGLAGSGWRPPPPPIPPGPCGVPQPAVPDFRPTARLPPPRAGRPTRAAGGGDRET